MALKGNVTNDNIFRLQVTPNLGWDLQLELEGPKSLSGRRLLRLTGCHLFFPPIPNILFPRIMQNESLQMMGKKTEVMDPRSKETREEEKGRR